MRRTVLLLASAALVVLLASGVVGAADSTCGGDGCVGTRGSDNITGSDFRGQRIAGLEGDDVITGGAGIDNFIYGDEGNDTITFRDETTGERSGDTVYGDEGNDTISVTDDLPVSDQVYCGPGKRDKVFYNEGIDIVAKSCEIKRPE